MTVCNLFSNVWAIIVQGCLGVAVFSLLIVKWRCEQPRREFRVWAFDALKQCISAGFQHGCNVAIAAIARSEGGEGNEECGWYIISFTIDAVLGTALSIFALKYMLEPLAKKLDYHPLIESGDYGQPHNINIKWWGIQLTSWVLINILARVVCGGIVYGLHDPIHPFIRWLTHKFKGHGILYLLLSMVGTPTFLNIAQLMIQDTVLMKNKRRFSRSQTDEADGPISRNDKYPLMNVEGSETQTEYAPMIGVNGINDAKEMEDMAAMN